MTQARNQDTYTQANNDGDGNPSRALEQSSLVQQLQEENHHLRQLLEKQYAGHREPPDDEEYLAYEELRNKLWGKSGESVVVPWPNAKVPIWSVLNSYKLPDGVNEDDVEDKDVEEDIEEMASSILTAKTGNNSSQISTEKVEEIPGQSYDTVQIFKHNDLDLIVKFDKASKPEGYEDHDFEFFNLYNIMDDGSKIDYIMPCCFPRILSRKCYFKLESFMIKEAEGNEQERRRMEHAVNSNDGMLNINHKRPLDDELGVNDQRDTKKTRFGPDQALRQLSSRQAKYFVITGQPGVGKSVFTTWLLIRRIERAEPTILRTKGGSHYYFNNSCCSYIDKIAKVLKECRSDPNVWYIADGGVDSALENPKASNWVILLVSSPKPEVWSQIAKHNSRCCCLLYMPAWPWPEIYATGVYVESLSGADVKETWRQYMLYGPVPRTLFKDLDPWGNAEKRARLENQYRKKVYNKIRTMIRSNEEAWLSRQWNDADSHTIILTQVTNDTFTTSTRVVITPWVGWCFGKLDRTRREGGIRSFFFNSELSSKASTLRGHIFEDIVHQLCETERSLELTNISNKTKSSYVVRHSQVFDGLSHLMKLTKSPIKFSRKCNTDVLNVYLRPGIPNFESVDALMITDTAVLLFQITCARSHPVSAKGLDIIYTKMSSWIQARKWILVFICPENQTAAKFGLQTLKGEEDLVKKWERKLEPQAILTIPNEWIRSGHQ